MIFLSKANYDENIVKYQIERQNSELEKVFQERVTPGGTEEVIWYSGKVDEQNNVKIRDKVKDDITIDSDVTLCLRDNTSIEKPLQTEERPKKVFIKTHSKAKDMPKDEFQSKEPPTEQMVGREGIDVTETKTSEQTTEIIQSKAPTAPESVIRGKEIVSQTQKQIQKEQKGDEEITRHIRTTETVDHEHKSVVKERKVFGKITDTKAPVFTKKITPCRAYERSEAHFHCIFTGTPTPTITWFRENFVIQDSTDFKVILDLDYI